MTLGQPFDLGQSPANLPSSKLSDCAPYSALDIDKLVCYPLARARTLFMSDIR